MRSRLQFLISDFNQLIKLPAWSKFYFVQYNAIDFRLFINELDETLMFPLAFCFSFHTCLLKITVVRLRDIDLAILPRYS